MEPSPNEQLDSVLFLIGDQKNYNGGIRKGEIIEELKGKNIEFKDEVLVAILVKLGKDDLIRAIPTQMGVPPVAIDYCYRLTFEGIVFKENRGYQGKFLAEEAERIKVELLRTNQIEIQKAEIALAQMQTKIQISIRNLTCLVAFGTIVAAVYYAVQLLFGSVHLFHHDCH